MTAGELLGYAWHSFLVLAPVLPAIGSAVLIVGTAVTVATVIAMSVVYRRTAATLRKQALSDPLTGLYNRRAFFEALETRLAWARSADRDRFAVAVLDLDNMKQINDTLGHLAGDEALKMAAEAIRRGIRDTDLACRYGGDEFAVLFTRKGPSAATLGLRLAVNVEELLAGQAFRISFTVGVAYYPEDGTTADALLAAADYRMYEQKRRMCGHVFATLKGTAERGGGSAL
jgi:diguanylate cyclase (GGDEF)-like protein